MHAMTVIDRKASVLFSMSSTTSLTSPVPVEVRRHTHAEPWTYAMLDQRQREIAERARAGGPGALLLSEVAPVITKGRRAPATDLTLPPELLARQGIELLTVDRGGLATYHGPGQWVLFAVDRLERLTGDRKGVRKAVHALLAIALEVGRKYDSTAAIREGAELGVWTRRGKFAAVGVHVQQGVLLHGLSVNGFRTPQSFVGLRPCGLDAPVDFLLGTKGEGDDDARFADLGEELIQAACAYFRSFSPSP